MATIRLLGDCDAEILAAAAPEVFDNPVDPALAAAFLKDPRHHIVAALDGKTLVGFVSAVDYWHPDKPRELFVNEVGVAPSHQRRGFGLGLLRAMLAHGRALGCVNAWVLTDADNIAANGLYARAGGETSGVDPVMYTFPLDRCDP